MQFLANENFPFPSIKLLRQKGYKIISITENLPGIADEAVLKKAVNEELVILTFDSDYGKLLFKYKLSPPPAVIYFRFKGSHPVDAAKILIDKIENKNFRIEGFFTVIEKENIRQRKL
jgi:predicted nuclease of predicted toxin-antitoxin system